MSHINNKKPRVIEGEIRSKELSKYLEEHNAPKIVWLSEDASGIVEKVCYDSATNQLVGLVLPLNSETGNPIPFSFTPRTEKEMIQLMKKPKSTLVYIVMAQPMDSAHSPPFLLQIFGTDNKFRTQDVLHRWNETKNELKK